MDHAPSAIKLNAGVRYLGWTRPMAWKNAPSRAMAYDTRALQRMALDAAPKHDSAIVAPSHLAAFDENNATDAACAMVVSFATCVIGSAYKYTMLTLM